MPECSRRASAAALSVWMLVGIVLFSHQIRLHPRYVEGFTPAVAAMMGIGVAWAASPGGPRKLSRLRLGALLVTLALVVYYSERLVYGYPVEWWISLLAALGAATCALLARSPRLPISARRWLAPGGVIVLTLIAALVVPLKADQTAIVDRISDAGLVGQLPGSQQHPLSAYLRAHQGGAYYELAAESATAVGSLIVQDARPVLMLTSYDGRVLTTVAKLEQLIAQGKVRYAFLNTFCAGADQSVNPACSAPARWVRARGTDVSLEAGLSQGGLLYRLPGVRP